MYMCFDYRPIYEPHVCNAHRKPKKTLNLLKLEPMVFDSQFVDAGNQTRGKAVSDLKCQANIPDPVFNF